MSSSASGRADRPAAGTVLCSGTLRTGIPFRERLAAAGAGGFSAVSLWGRDYEDARREGLTDADMAALLDDHGLVVAELDPAWWWLPGAADVRIPPDLDDERIFAFGERELFAIADALGARSLNAVDVFGGSWSLDEATASFAACCERAAEHGLLVHIEFLPWSRIPDLRTAWRIARDADQPNGGIAVDAWHYDRSGSAADRGVLRAVPGEHILAVQLCDGPAGPDADPIRATLHERRLPGAGTLDLAALVEDLRATGTTAPWGVEVFSDELDALPSEEVGRRAGASLAALLGPPTGAPRRA